MVFKKAMALMSKDDRMSLWMDRIESVDRVLESSTTGWQLEFWGRVRRQLVRQFSLLSLDVTEK